MDLFTKVELSLLRVFVFAIILAPLCLLGGGEITAVEPVITWNLYITPVVVGVSTAVIMIFINRLFRRRDDREEEIKKLLAEKEILKEENINQWRKTYTDAQGAIKDTQCIIKNSVDRIEIALTGKVDKSDCIRESKDQWDAINKLREV